MPRAFITGATGFVGAAVLRELLRRGWEVSALHREGSDLSNLQGLERPFDRVVGGLDDVETLKRGMDGCDHVFHVAAAYRFGWKHSADLYRSNHQGTKNIFAAARSCGVSKIVYTSTVGVLHPRADGVSVDESELSKFDELAGPYKKSKWLAEMAAIEEAKNGLPVVSVLPSAPVGRYDVKPTPTGQMIVDFCRGKMPAYVDTGLNLVDVEDVAVGQLLAAEKGVVGERYILGSENLRLREIFEILADITGRPAPKICIPKKLLLPIALCSESISWILRSTPKVSLENARMSQAVMFFDTAKAKRDLGFEPAPGRQGLERAVEWFREHGYV